MSKVWIDKIRENTDVLVDTAKRFGYDTVGVLAPKDCMLTRIVFGTKSNTDAVKLLSEVTEQLKGYFPENEFMIVASNNLAVQTLTLLVYAGGVYIEV